MNERDTEIRRLAPKANFARLFGIAVLLGAAGAATLKGLGEIPELPAATISLAAIAGFTIFLIGRVRMGVVDADIARKIDEAEG